MDHYSTRTLDKNKREPRYNYMTWKQKLEVIEDINEVALVLLEFYYSKTGYEKYEYSDEQVAHALNWTVRKTRDYRLRLEKAGYFSQAKGSNSKGDTFLYTSLGHRRWSK